MSSKEFIALSIRPCRMSGQFSFFCGVYACPRKIAPPATVTLSVEVFVSFQCGCYRLNDVELRDQATASGSRSLWTLKSGQSSQAFSKITRIGTFEGRKGQHMVLVSLALLIFRIAVRKRFSCSSRRRLSTVSSQLSCWAITVACMAA